MAEEDITQFTAKDARKLVIQTSPDLKKILAKIKSAASKGEEGIRLDHSISTTIQKNLQRRGFQVSTERGDYTEPGHTEIDW